MTLPTIWQLACNDNCTIHAMFEHAHSKERITAYKAWLDDAADAPDCSPHTVVKFMPTPDLQDLHDSLADDGGEGYAKEALAELIERES